jgi:TerC family integral membrane protein
VIVPVWAWAAFAVFVLAMLMLDLFVLHRRAHEVSLREAAIWSGVWVTIGLGFGGVLWLLQGGDTGQAYLAGYLIEKSLSLDNIFVFAVIFAAFAIPARYQHRVLMLGILGALVMRAVFIVAGIRLLETFHPVIYVFGAILLIGAVKMLRDAPPQPERSRALRLLRRVVPATEKLHGQRFLVRDGTRLLATPLLLALILIEITDVIFAVDSIPAVLAVTTDPFVVYTSNVFALLGMRALYFLLAGATAEFRYLRPGLAVILAAVAAKMLLADLYKFPAWVSPAFIAVVLAVVAVLSIRDRRRHRPGPLPAPHPSPRKDATHAVQQIHDQPGERRLEHGGPVRRLPGRPAGGRPAVRRRLPGRAARHHRLRRPPGRTGDRAADQDPGCGRRGGERSLGRPVCRHPVRPLHQRPHLAGHAGGRRRVRRPVGGRVRVRRARRDPRPARLQLVPRAVGRALRPGRPRRRRAGPGPARAGRPAPTRPRLNATACPVSPASIRAITPAAPRLDGRLFSPGCLSTGGPRYSGLSCRHWR